ncbi:MAG: hypothetical protein PHX25_03255 [Candidatus Pacebacteria bacterium]|nr:hypothetical protein [Candidatus Paceibacterota bacterium]
MVSDGLAPIYQKILSDMEKDLNGVIYSTCSPKNRDFIARACETLVSCAPKQKKHKDFIISELVRMKKKIEHLRNDDALRTMEELGNTIRELEVKSIMNHKGVGK